MGVCCAFVHVLCHCCTPADPTQTHHRTHSPYKFWGRGGAGREAWVHVLPAPDPYRGQHLDGRLAARGAVAEARAGGGEVAAFICESVLSCGGQVGVLCAHGATPHTQCM